MNLLDMMTEADRALVASWAEDRKHPRYKQDIPVPYYVCAQLGHYYGWQAVVDLRRGHHIGITSKGERIRIPFSFEDAVALIEAAQKVEYTCNKS